MNEGFIERRAQNIDYRSELVRKAIHLTSLSIPVVYYFVTRNFALTVLIPLTVAFIVVDVARYYHRPVGDLFYNFFGFLLRRHERDTKTKRLNGATYVLISATLCVLIFPKHFVILGFSILIISDSVAALVGRRFGRHRFFEKSLEGSAAFFASALLVVALTPKHFDLPVEFLFGAVAALVATVAEAASVNIDDNLTIPVSVAATLWILYAVFLPQFDVFQFKGAL